MFDKLYKSSHHRNYMKFNHVFITGGAGYVCSALFSILLEKRYRVTVYDLYLYADALKPHKNLMQIKGDIRDREKLMKVANGADAFIPLACISNNPSFYLDTEL